MAWDPTQYLAFGDERLQPALDLLSRIPLDSPETVLDLGCGPGNVTRELKGRWPNAAFTGVDSSSEMLERAREQDPGIEWIEDDLNDWRPQTPVDLLYSNATLHWLDEHDKLFPRLMKYLAPGGYLAVQMPRNWLAPSHTCVTVAVHAGPWRELLEPLLRPFPTHEPSFYYEALSPVSNSLAIWETEYCQILEGDNPVAEFVKGTQLKRFLDALDEPERSEFEDEYRKRILAAYPKRLDGKTLFTFRRIFILAGL